MSKILVVDDECRFRGMIREMLLRAGYEVLEAANGIEALRQCQTNSVDLIILDIVMPEKDGLETLIELRRDWPKIKVLAISGGGRIGPEPYLEFASRLGAHQALTKPIEYRHLIETIAGLLAGN